VFRPIAKAQCRTCARPADVANLAQHGFTFRDWGLQVGKAHGLPMNKQTFDDGRTDGQPYALRMPSAVYSPPAESTKLYAGSGGEAERTAARREVELSSASSSPP